jgi:hypothetical protein
MLARSGPGPNTSWGDLDPEATRSYDWEMKRIHYASGSLVTGDKIADVLLSYAAVLATNEAAAEVRAPALSGDGTVGSVLLLLGPASQMMAEDEQSEHPDVEDAEFVAACEKQMAAMGPRRAGYVTEGIDDAGGIDLDYL